MRPLLFLGLLCSGIPLRPPSFPPESLGSLTDRELNYLLKTLPRDLDPADLLALARAVHPERWAFDANLNLLLQTLFDARQPAAAADFLARLDRPLPPRSATFAVRGLLQSGLLEPAGRLYLAQDPQTTPAPCHLLYLRALLEAGRLDECAGLLGRVEAAGAEDPSRALAALRLLLLAEAGEESRCADLWASLRCHVNDMDAEAIQLLAAALALSGLWQEARAFPRLLPAVAHELGLWCTPLSALEPMLNTSPGALSVALGGLVEGYRRAGREDLIVAILDVEDPPLLRAKTLNLILAAVKTQADSARPRTWARAKALYSRQTAAGAVDEVRYGPSLAAV